MFNRADNQRDGRVVFDPRLRESMLAGCRRQLVTWVNHRYRVVHVRFIGTHRTYDTIDAQTI
jgi:mRNA-degrading endonuclease HigB of HigAB toxin-antitoxin module